ncbi:hypothetical protein KAZ01_01475 [Candidatus Gracilibacteria bacterium]|nr:hypothetical protein [Candidatus Gracilibacteria bacterium]
MNFIDYHKKFKQILNIKENPNKYELELFKKTQKYVRFISYIPGLKLVGICNSLSMYATKEKGSDIDLFIITEKNKLWFVRIFATFIFQILGVRRYGNKIKERLCLSFFITENAMDFSKIAIENDIYLFYWIYYLKPILNKDNTYELFIKANKSMGIDYSSLHEDNLKYIKIQKCGNIEKIFSPILDLFNNIFKRIFLARTLNKKKNLSNSSGIIISDDMLKFHDNDKRKEIREKIYNL